MDEQKTLTLDLVKSLMESAYMLVWTDYDDNLDNHRDPIQKCLDSKGRERLWEKADMWYSDAEWEAVRGIIVKLKEEYTIFNDFDREDVDDFFDEHEDGIHDEIYSQNDSDMIKELAMCTDNIPIRVEMFSSYDCINPHQLKSQGGYRYEESYFGDMVDSLNLNPARVRKILTKHSYKTYGRSPSRKSWNSREQVSYEQLCEELIDSCYGTNSLTYIGRVSPEELYETGFSLKEVVIPRGNYCGPSSSIYGGGSLLEMEPRENVRLKLEVKDYHGFRFRLDDERFKYECSIRHVYGVNDSFFGEGISLVVS